MHTLFLVISLSSLVLVRFCCPVADARPSTRLVLQQDWLPKDGRGASHPTSRLKTKHRPANATLSRAAEGLQNALLGSWRARVVGKFREIGRASCRERVCQYV